MNAKRFSIAAAVLFLLSFASLAEGWKGSASVNAGIPISATSVQFCGAANGVWALCGELGIVFGFLFLFIAGIRALVGLRR